MPLLRLALALLLIGPASAQDAGAELPDAPKPIKRTLPRMPEWALIYEQPGEAVVRLVIDKTGATSEPTLLAEYPRGKKFGEAAVASVRTYKFEAGKPGTYKVTVKFNIQNAPRVKPKEGQTFDGIVPIAPPPIDPTKPVYPLMAQEKPMEGTVQLLVAIEDGSIERGGVVESGDVSNVFGDVAFNAAVKWHFPDTEDGNYLVEIPFTIERLKAGEFSATPRSPR
ncbi:MAG: energy transducer TonB [Micropepsaceae bacterium]